MYICFRAPEIPHSVHIHEIEPQIHPLDFHSVHEIDPFTHSVLWNEALIS